MPSLLHEALIELFRNRPRLAPDLLSEELEIELPRWTEARVQESTLTEVMPAEFRADLVVLLHEGVPVFGIVLEVQLGPDDDKQYSWPAYVASLRRRLRVPCCLMVVAPDAAVARWASRSIDTGQPGCPFVPVVVGPEAVPQVTDPEQARLDPELAVLSALAHAQAPRGSEVAFAAAVAARGLDDQTARFYYDLVASSLSEAARRALEDMMRGYQYQSEFAKKYVAEGRAEGRVEGRVEGRAEGMAVAKAEVLVKLLIGKGLAVSEEQRAKVLACRDLEVLDRWIERAFEAKVVEDVFGR